VVTLDEMLHVPIVFLGLSLPEHGYHAPNENFDWGQASGGMRAFVKYLILWRQENNSTETREGGHDARGTCCTTCRTAARIYR